MKNLTLVIPAKKESESLPHVLREIEKFACKKMIVIEENDQDTIKSINNHDCKIVFQDKKGYGDAIIKGINSVDTEYLCIFNADGSFDPKYLYEKLELCKNYDYIFSSRYMKTGGSEDDTFITKIGNFIFSLLGNIFFSLKLSDILYTFIVDFKYSTEEIIKLINNYIGINISKSFKLIKIKSLPTNNNGKIEFQKLYEYFK